MLKVPIMMVNHLSLGNYLYRSICRACRKRKEFRRDLKAAKILIAKGNTSAVSKRNCMNKLRNTWSH